MYNLVKRTIELNHTSYMIKCFDVWFQTPFGLIDDLDLAIGKLKENDFDPTLPGMIVPVTVAIGEGVYEVMSK